VKRREFLQTVAKWTAGLGLAPPMFRITPSLLAAEKPLPKLIVGSDTDYAALVSKILGPFGGIEAFVTKGAKVVVKPNIGWDRKPEHAANTHPLVVEAIVRACLKGGAAQVLVFDRTCNDERRCYTSSGIKDAVERIGDVRARCEFIDERKFVPIRIARGTSIKEWEFYRPAIEADCYINVPVAKDHGLSGLTLCMKNVMGVIGGNRGHIHRNIGQRLADLNTVIRPTVNIIDATRILTAHGPQGGSLDDVKWLHTLIASPDIIAADAYATTLFGRKPISSTIEGHAAGLGEKNLKRVNIVKV